jgi:hypothetical protein
MRKLKRLYRQLRCKHNWVEIRDPKNEIYFERARRNPLFQQFPIDAEHQCTKCGKVKVFGIGFE